VIGGGIFAAGLVAPGHLAGVATTLIVVGAGQMSVSIMLPRLAEFEIGPGGVKTKMATEASGPRRMFEAEADRLNRFAYLMCGDRGQARELVESALMRVRKQARRIPPDERGADTLRTLVELLDTAPERRWLSGMSGRGVMRDAPAEREDAIVGALGRLDFPARAAFVLRVDWPLPLQEVSTLLGRPADEVRQDIESARDLLRPYIEGTHAP
jgi:DNA-directed RNA polymerase specialized sigma24 family protein